MRATRVPLLTSPSSTCFPLKSVYKKRSLNTRKSNIKYQISGPAAQARPDLPLASAGSDMIGWSRVLLSHTLDAALSY